DAPLLRTMTSRCHTRRLSRGGDRVRHPATTFCLNRRETRVQIAPGAGGMGAIAGRRWAWTFAFSTLYFGLAAPCGSPASAQGHRSEPTPASPPTTTLTGDWGGLRPYLDSNGVTFTFNYTNDFLANVRGGIGPGAVAIGVFQPELDLDLQKLVGWEGGKFHTH